MLLYFTCIEVIISQNVGIGTTSPQARLHVNGNFKLVDGSQGDGKVLTSDAQGMASWSNPPSSSSFSDPAGFGTWNKCDDPTLSNYEPKFSEQAKDGFGYDIEMNDSFAFVSSVYFDTLGYTDRGCINVLRFVDDKWQIVQRLIDPTGESSDFLGTTLSADENFLIVGSQWDDDSGIVDKGSVCIFKKVNGQWTFLQKIVQLFPTYFFGLEVKVKNNLLVISEGNLTGYVPQAYIYEFDVTNNIWESLQTIPSPNTIGGFGVSIDIDGNYIAFGQPFLTVNDSLNSGTVHVYERIGANFYILNSIIQTNNLTNEYFGIKVCLDYPLIYIAGSQSRKNSIKSGAIHQYKLNGTFYQWLNFYGPSSISPFNSYGSQMGMNSKFIIAGSYSEEIQPTTRVGRVYIYKRLGESLSLLESFSPPNLEPNVGLHNCKMNNSGQFCLVFYDVSTPYVFFGKINLQ